ncbi:hypothetical protein HDU96_011088 [Phlyctochytrium bullatum]|nr:hypothetical protein HDU96_011088 [Phlyctochytrium bullatum]
MGRRKKAHLDDGIGSSDDDIDDDGDDGDFGDDLKQYGLRQEDLDEEQALFRNPDKKRRKRFTKESALYGIWADDSDDDRRGGSSSKRGGGRRNLSSGISFVKSDTKPANADELGSSEDDQDVRMNDDDDEDEDDGDAQAMDVDAGKAESEDDSDDSEASHDAASHRMPRNRDEEEDENDLDARPGGGLGLGSGGSNGFGGLGSGSNGFARGGLGLGATPQRTGLGAKEDKGQAAPSPKPNDAKSSPAVGSVASAYAQMPKAFGSTRQGLGNKRPTLGGGDASPSPAAATSKPPPKKPTPIEHVDRDFAKFERYSKGVGLKYLQKMGFVPGQGLGKEGRGIAQPIDVKVRPSKMGLGHKGFDERTETVKRDQQKQKSQYVLSDDEDKKKQAAAGEDDTQPEQVWRRGTKKPRKPRYKLAAEVVLEQQLMMAGQTIDGVSITAAVVRDKIIDMTGRDGARELSSLAEASYAAAVKDTTSHLVELRHNLRMLVSEAELQLVALARNLTLDKARIAAAEEGIAAAVARKAAAEERMAGLRAAKGVLDRVRDEALRLARVVQAGSDVTEDDLDAAFTGLFAELEVGFLEEYVEHGMDEVVVSALVPAVRRLYVEWNPLEDPTRGVTVFTKWRKLLKTFGVVRRKKEDGEKGVAVAETRAMTPYENLMYMVWLPPVRAAVKYVCKALRRHLANSDPSNFWQAREPDAFLRLIEAWYPSSPEAAITVKHGIAEHASASSPHLLPPWLHTNVISQLLLPKLLAEIEDWNPKKDMRPCHTWLFPWLPVLGERFKELYEPVWHKLTLMFADWFPDDQAPVKVLLPWLEVSSPPTDPPHMLTQPLFPKPPCSQVFPESISTSLLNKSILPKLVAILRLEFTVNPANQNNAPLDWVLPWRTHLGPSTFSHLLETEFFPKWIEALHMWLSIPDANYDEITMWYLAWKGFFPKDVVALPGIEMQFGVGLDLMNRCLALREGESLGPVPKIVPYANVETMKRLVDGKKAPRSTAGLPEFQRRKETTMSFRDLLEKMAGDKGLTLLPSAKTHRLGKMVLRLGGTADGRDVGGVLCYVDDAVVYVQEGQGFEEAWTPYAVDDAILLASARRARK